jgi:hypothetical protein
MITLPPVLSIRASETSAEPFSPTFFEERFARSANPTLKKVVA